MPVFTWRWAACRTHLGEQDHVAWRNHPAAPEDPPRDDRERRSGRHRSEKIRRFMLAIDTSRMNVHGGCYSRQAGRASGWLPNGGDMPVTNPRDFRLKAGSYKQLPDMAHAGTLDPWQGYSPRNCNASPRCVVLMFSAGSRSAIVRATRRTRSWPRAVSASRVSAVSTSGRVPRFERRPGAQRPSLQLRVEPAVPRELARLAAAITRAPGRRPTIRRRPWR